MDDQTPTPTPAPAAAPATTAKTPRPKARKAPAAAAPKVSADTSAADERFTLRHGTIEFDAPSYMGGSRISLSHGEPVSPKVWPHVPEAQRDQFVPYVAPTAR
jgi:hypothetical protein